MHSFGVRPLAAGVLLCLFVGAAQSQESPVVTGAAPSLAAPADGGFFGRNAQALNHVPVKVIALHDELRAQISYQYVDTSWATNNAMLTNSLGPYANTMGGVVAGALGASLGEALVNAKMQQDAEDAVRPAYLELQHAGCALPLADDTFQAVARSLASTSWGPSAEISTAVRTNEMGIKNLLDDEKPRHVVLATHSFTPDFSSVVTTLDVELYSDAFEGALAKWQSKPASRTRLIVVSDPMALDAKTAEDTQALLAAEKERYTSGPANEVIAKANAGDRKARKDALVHIKHHRDFLRHAAREEWVPATAAAARSARWSADDCAPLRAATSANLRDLEGMLAQLYADALSAAASQTAPADAEATRELVALDDATYLSQPLGASTKLNFLYSWYLP